MMPCLVDVCLELVDQAPHHDDIAYAGCIAQGGVALFISLVDVSVELFDQALHDIEIAQLRGLTE
jgi:hypothetical protein